MFDTLIVAIMTAICAVILFGSASVVLASLYAVVTLLKMLIGALHG